MSGGRKHNGTNVAARAIKKPILRTNKKPPQTPRKVKFARATHGESAAKRALDLEDKAPLELTKPQLAVNVESEMPDCEEPEESAGDNSDAEHSGEDWPLCGPEDVKAKPEAKPDAKLDATPEDVTKPEARLDTFFDSKLPNKEIERKAAELDARLNAYVQSWITMRPTDVSLASVAIWSLEQEDFVLPNNIEVHFPELVQKRKWWTVVEAVPGDDMVEETDDE